MKIASGNLRRQHGQTMVETAIVMVLFLMLYFGIVGFGRAIWAYSWTSHIAREAARWAAVRQTLAHNSCASTGTTCCSDATCLATEGVITTYVKSHMLGLNPANATVTADFTNGTNQGAIFTVKVTYQVTQLVPFVPAMTVGSSSSMAISQ